MRKRHMTLIRATRRAKTYSFWVVTLAAFSFIATAFTTPVAAETPAVQVVSVMPPRQPSCPLVGAP